MQVSAHPEGGTGGGRHRGVSCAAAHALPSGSHTAHPANTGACSCARALWRRARARTPCPAGRAHRSTKNVYAAPLSPSGAPAAAISGRMALEICSKSSGPIRFGTSPAKHAAAWGQAGVLGVSNGCCCAQLAHAGLAARGLRLLEWRASAHALRPAGLAPPQVCNPAPPHDARLR